MKTERTKKQIAIRFILIMIGCAMLGGVAGFALMFASGSAYEAMVRFEALLAGLGAWWYLPGAILLVLGTGYYMAGKRQLPHIEEEAMFERAGRLLDLSVVFTGIASAYIITAMALSYFKAVAVSVLLLIVEMAWAAVIQAKAVNAVKLLYPEKRGSVWDTRFQKDWYGSCDEAERQRIGQCSYRTFMTMNKVYPAIMVLLTIMALFNLVTPVASLLVGLLWLVQQTTYLTMAHKMDYGKGKRQEDAQ